MSAQTDLVQAFLQAQAVERAEWGDDASREMACSIGTPSWRNWLMKLSMTRPFRTAMNPTATMIETGMSRNRRYRCSRKRLHRWAICIIALRQAQPGLRHLRVHPAKPSLQPCGTLPEVPQPSPSAQHSLQHSVPVNEPVLQRAANVNGDQRSEKV